MKYILPFLFGIGKCAIAFAICSALPLDAASVSKKDASQKKVARQAPRPTTQVLIAVNNSRGITAAQYAASKKMRLIRTLESDPKMAVVAFNTVAEARRAIAAMQRDTRIRRASFNRVLPHVPFAFVADDPYFSGQWHLGDSLATLPGVSVAGPWAKDITGKGVIIGIVDEGVNKDHEDIKGNFVAADSYDFAANDPDPSPVGTGNNESHGTSVAGVAAGRGGNDIGITGAAPLAGIAGLKVTFDGESTIADFVNAVKYHSVGGNRRIQIKNHSYGFSFPFIEDIEEYDAFTASAAAGTIHTVSAGNDRFPYGYNLDGTDSGDIAEDSNKSMLANNPSVITVAALASSKRFADYSSFGSNVFVTASSSSFRQNELSILTTDRTGANGYNITDDDTDGDDFADLNYTGTFGGTSSSAPLVAGVLALVKQANPALNVRLAKHLIARTSVKVDPSNPTWLTNAAGLHFSNDYGFGLIDANALVTLAQDYVVTPLQTRVTGVVTVNKLVPEGGSLSKTLPVPNLGKVEEIRVRLVVDAEYEGDLEATITSPSGTVSRFCHSSAFDSTSGTLDWSFTSNAFWAEPSAGNWIVTVTDAALEDALTWKSVQLTVRSGQIQNAPAPPNDRFALAGGLTGKEFSVGGSNKLCTAEPGEPAHAGITASKSLWWKWTAPATGAFLAKTEGSQIDTVLAIYRGNAVNRLTRVAANNDYNGTNSSAVSLLVTKGVTYYFAVDSGANEGGGVVLAGTFIPSVTIKAVDARASEPGRDMGSVRIYRDSGYSLPLNLKYSISGTAENGVDYRGIALDQVMEPSRLVSELLIRPLDDGTNEPTKTVTVQLLPSPDYYISGPSVATVRIYDND